MKLLLKTLFTFLGIALIAACTKEETTEKYFWAQTGCAEPWNAPSNHTNSEIEEEVIDYLVDP